MFPYPYYLLYQLFQQHPSPTHQRTNSDPYRLPWSLNSPFCMECRICSSPSTGFHYKITSCRACAAFFRRTLQLKLRYKCQADGNCCISEDNRFNCKQCRLKKCVSVGMIAPEGEDVDFLDSCINDPQSSFYTENEFFSPENIFPNFEKFAKQLKKRVFALLSRKQTQDSCDIFIIKQADSAYKYHEKQYPSSNELIQENVLDLKAKVVSFYKELLILTEFCSRIKPFSRLPLDQKAIIFKDYLVKFMHLDRTYITVQLLGDDRNDTRTITLDGKIWDMKDSMINLKLVTDLTEKELKRLFSDSESAYINCFCNPFKVVKPDRFELLYLMMYSLFDTRNLLGITAETDELCKEVLDKLGDELQFYYKHEVKLENTARRIYKLHGLLSCLDRIAEMRKQNDQMSKTFDLFKKEIHLMDDFDLKEA